MDRDCVLYRKRYLSADERAKERTKSQMQAASRPGIGLEVGIDEINIAGRLAMPPASLRKVTGCRRRPSDSTSHPAASQAYFNGLTLMVSVESGGKCQWEPCAGLLHSRPAQRRHSLRAFSTSSHNP